MTLSYNPTNTLYAVTIGDSLQVAYTDLGAAQARADMTDGATVVEIQSDQVEVPPVDWDRQTALSVLSNAEQLKAT